MSEKVRAADLIEEAIKELQLTIRDAEKADAGNVSAGVRTRKRMQEVIGKLKDKKPEFDFMQTSLVRTEVKVTCHYEVGGLQDPSEEKDAFREKALKGMEKWLSLASDKRPQNDTRKPEKKDK